jgi:phosphoribosylaminoimidazolecarboxamide formyltransferase/IMP cyclohydrolase
MSVALISVYDKTGIVEFARSLVEMGWKIVSSGGTARTLRESGVSVESVEELTGLSPILGGRVKTLHPTVHAGILARRDVPEDVETLKREGIETIDLVAVDLYPFEKAASDRSLDERAVEELIDVGGPTLLRAAAKNWRSVITVSAPSQYEDILSVLRDGGPDDDLRRSLAARAFARLSSYDARVASWLSDSDAAFPSLLAESYERGEALRYGENPHQEAAVYRRIGETGPSVTTARVLSGKTLSYCNLADLDLAMRAAAAFDAPTAIVVKHASPCGIASANTLARAIEDAVECDPLSAYGCVIVLNREVDPDVAQFIHKMPFVEVVGAPTFAEESLALMRKKKARRLVELGSFERLDPLVRKGVAGGMLVQRRDDAAFDRTSAKVVTHRAPTEEEWSALEFAFGAVRWVVSNAVVLVRGTATVGIGGGQPNRVDSVRIAATRAGDRAQNSVLGSDALFPFADGVAAAAEAGVSAVVQPGGSKRDGEVIEASDAAGMAMVFTGTRTFRH